LCTGTRKKVGFAYDMLADTAADVANEMVDNLSLDSGEADYIATLIQVGPQECCMIRPVLCTVYGTVRFLLYVP